MRTAPHSPTGPYLTPVSLPMSVDSFYTHTASVDALHAHTARVYTHATQLNKLYPHTSYIHAHSTHVPNKTVTKISQLAHNFS